MRIRKQQPGFTIVELLIVIVVIGILAAITIVAYNGMQDRASDAKIRSSANQLDKAIQLWYSETGLQIRAGFGTTGAITGDTCPISGSGGGFVAKAASGYLCGLDDLLFARNLLPTNFFSSLPPNTTSGNSGLRVFMYTPCLPLTTNKYMLAWFLKSPSTAETAALDSAITECGTGASYRDTYGARNGKIFILN